jgi:ribonuclease BN (tRNA processing enzyme)
MMDIIFLGSGDAFGSGGRLQTCIGVVTEETTILVDCGATSLTAMKQQGFDPLRVDAVVVSHLHADHFGGLPFLILDAQFRRRTAPLRVVGPPGTEARLMAAMEVMYPGSSTVQRRFAVEVSEIVPGASAISVDAARIRGVEVDHACGAPPLAVRVEIGARTFAYSGDTAWTPALLDIAQGADLFAVEAYTFERKVRYHLDYRTIETNLPAFGAARVMLTHMSPDMLGRLGDSTVDAATDGLVIHF